MHLDNDQKRKLIQMLLEDKRKLNVLSREYGVHPEYVRKLLKRARVHGVESILANGRRTHTVEFKLEVIRFVENGNLVSDAALIYNLSDALVLDWCRKYSEGGFKALNHVNGGRLLKEDRQESETTREKPVHTEKEFEELQRQLRRAQMENEFLKKLDALVRERIEREGRK